MSHDIYLETEAYQNFYKIKSIIYVPDCHVPYLIFKINKINNLEEVIHTVHVLS